MMKTCRYHERMKYAYYFVGSILACITTAFAADISLLNGTTPQNDTVSASTTENTAGNIPEQPMLFYAFGQIPDSTEVRKTITQTWFLAPIEKVIAKEQEVYTDSKGNKFTVSGKYAKDHSNEYIISIIPNFTDFRIKTHNPILKGSWFLHRNSDTGAPICIKIYPSETSMLSIVLRPAPEKAYSGKTFIDVCLYNAYVCRDVTIGIPFETLYHIPLSRLKELTETLVPWNLCIPPQYDSPVKKMVHIIEEFRHRLVSLTDACFDHEGNPVHISNTEQQTEFEINAAMAANQIRSEISGGVDSAGFAKWIIDGIIRPIAGEGTHIESLKRATEVPNTHFTQAYREHEPIFFGLDWIRNLGAAALTLNLQHTVYPEASGLDVTVSPFALTGTVLSEYAESTVRTTLSFLGYKKYAGYQTTYLVPLLYYLAITEPDHFYLACINNVSQSSEQRIYNRIAVLFPYFDSWGTFHIVLYEHGVPIAVDNFINENSSAYAALVRVRAPEPGLFNP